MKMRFVSSTPWLFVVALLTGACSQPPAPAATPINPPPVPVLLQCDPKHPPPTPFADNDGLVPLASTYSGALFALSHEYPSMKPAPPIDPPWIKALDKKNISSVNAIAYTNALKDYVAEDIKTLIFDYPNWHAGNRGWYNEPWVGCEREPIHGMYPGSFFPIGTFKEQKADLQTWVVTFYDTTAAYSLSQVWGTDAMKANLTDGRAQFPEGSVIVKVAMTTIPQHEFSPLAGAPTWQLFSPLLDADGHPKGAPVMQSASLLQIDLIVKDSRTSPKTGWVFTTIVYDPSVDGDGWTRMVPLGAMWGNDPQATKDGDPLRETVINAAAPAYSKETLGWGGRLSGPNDGAVVAPAIINTLRVKTQAASSCMACHIAAQSALTSFLLPSRGKHGTQDPAKVLVLEAPGSKAWMRWFQDLDGATPLDPGVQDNVALDYDMVYAFKSLPQWARATKQPGHEQLRVAGADRFHPARRYSGK